MSDHSNSTLQGSPQSKTLALDSKTAAGSTPSPNLAPDLSSAERGLSTAPPLSTIHSGGPGADHNMYTLTSAPTLRDVRGNSDALAARRTRSRAMSQSSVPREAAMGRALSRVVSPPQVGLFGDVAPGEDDLSGMVPPVDEEQAEKEETARLAELAAQKEDDKVWEVTWDGPDDMDNPKNWSRAYRWYLTAVGGILVLNATFASSAPSGVIPQMEVYFGFGRELATLLIAIFVGGYCLGPLIWAPLSEVYGRRVTFLVSFFVYWMFQIGCALSKNTASIMIFRFLSGAFAACPLTNAGGLISDIWDSDTRGIAIAFFSLAPFAGPSLGPTVGGFMAVSGVPWQDLFWVLFGFAGFCFVLILFTVPETYAPSILATKAKKLRKSTGEMEYFAPLERQSVKLKDRLEAILLKPFKMLFLEPMLLATTLYMSFVYGILYLLFEAYPIVFTLGHGFSAGITGLMFLPLFLGGAVAVGVYVFYFNPRYVKKHHEVVQAGGMMVAPEARLEMALVGAVTFPIALFWFGWTSFPSISFWSPMLAGGLLGFSILFLFLALFNYIIDVYLFAAASALAGNTVCRSAFGTGFPMFATQMFENLNPRIASTVLGAIAVAFMPVPFLFIKFGPALRARSRYSPHAKKK